MKLGILLLDLASLAAVGIAVAINASIPRPPPSPNPCLYDGCESTSTSEEDAPFPPDSDGPEQTPHQEPQTPQQSSEAAPSKRHPRVSEFGVSCYGEQFTRSFVLTNPDGYTGAVTFNFTLERSVKGRPDDGLFWDKDIQVTDKRTKYGTDQSTIMLHVPEVDYWCADEEGPTYRAFLTVREFGIYDQESRWYRRV